MMEDVSGKKNYTWLDEKKINSLMKKMRAFEWKLIEKHG
jgi:hypothetical protein